MMKKAASLLIPVLLCLSSASFAAQTADQTVTFSDGSKALTFGHCGDTDLCASIQYPSGEKLSVFSEGAAYCQPYMLHFVKVDASGKTVFEYTRTINHDQPSNSGFGVHCGNSRDTQMVMDRGLIHMTVSENHDGTLSIAFTDTTNGNTRKQSSDVSTP